MLPSAAASPAPCDVELRVLGVADAEGHVLEVAEHGHVVDGGFCHGFILHPGSHQRGGDEHQRAATRRIGAGRVRSRRNAARGPRAARTRVHPADHHQQHQASRPRSPQVSVRKVHEPGISAHRTASPARGRTSAAAQHLMRQKWFSCPCLRRAVRGVALHSDTPCQTRYRSPGFHDREENPRTYGQPWAMPAAASAKKSRSPVTTPALIAMAVVARPRSRARRSP